MSHLRSTPVPPPQHTEVKSFFKTIGDKVTGWIGKASAPFVNAYNSAKRQFDRVMNRHVGPALAIVAKPMKMLADGLVDAAKTVFSCPEGYNYHDLPIPKVRTARTKRNTVVP